MINYAKHYIDIYDEAAVMKVLKSDFITQGPVIKQFEEALTDYTNYKYCKALNSGTAALHAACYAIGIKSGDEVIIPTISFVATANCITYCGGTPVFVDIDPDTLLIDIDSIKKHITPKTKAIISMDYAGQLCDYKAIRKICDDNKLFFISDSCHSFGGINTIAENTIPDIVCYSFHPAKHITSGEGGACLTNNYIYDCSIDQFRNHGRDKNGIMCQLGYNYRMPDINAALVLSQLEDKHLKFTRERFKIVDKYDLELKCSKLKKVDKRIHVYHLYVIKVNKRKKFMEYMKIKGINCAIHFKPIYEHLYYYNTDINYQKEYPNTEKIKNNIVSIPLYYSLMEDDQDHIIKCINEFIEVIKND
jgi:dTDP-4-amino-4,6-dideoxygalactose transaminase